MVVGFAVDWPKPKAPPVVAVGFAVPVEGWPKLKAPPPVVEGFVVPVAGWPKPNAPVVAVGFVVAEGWPKLNAPPVVVEAPPVDVPVVGCPKLKAPPVEAPVFVACWPKPKPVVWGFAPKLKAFFL